MPRSSLPIFFDASGQRNKWTLRAFFLFCGLAVIAALTFAFTVYAVPVPKAMALAMERPHPRPLAQQVSAIGQRFGAVSRAFSQRPSASAAPAKQLRVGFYAPWDDASNASLAAHIGDLDWVLPTEISVTGADHSITVAPHKQFSAIIATAPRKPLVLPLVQNVINGVWDTDHTPALLASPAARKTLLDRLETQIIADHGGGIVFDFEQVPAQAQADYQRLLTEAKQRFAPRGWLVTVSVPVGDPAWNLAAYGRIADYVFVMDYDEHTNDGEPGPVASQAWFVGQLDKALRALPPSKTIVAVGNYGYNWSGAGKGDPLSVEEAWRAAHESDAAIQLDPQSGNATFAYEEDDGSRHVVWMLDAAAAWNQLRASAAHPLAGVALWRLGTEDPGFWDVLRSYRADAPPASLQKTRSIGDVDIEGNGEILQIEHTPTDGARTLKTNAQGYIIDERYLRLPTPYVVRRTGYKPGYVALTFDDGPDADWTPKILDVLEQKKAPATFFVVGENAMAHPLLLNRIVAGGSEIGSHTFTHPNLSKTYDVATRIELNSTQRLVEAYTGRSIRLFRAPYFGDAEPTTNDELRPALLAQQRGYTNVGLHVDPGDWKRPGVQQIIDRTLAQVAAGNAERSGQIILLHDSGGDRAQTVAALPIIIDQLRARGYQFVPVSTLAGLSRDAVMPPIRGADLLAVRADIGIFILLAAAAAILKWLFFAAIALGIIRALTLAGLALYKHWRNGDWAPDYPASTPFVSVLIPAYNEERVIENSVRRVLASEGVDLEIIVINDGSKDATAEIVAQSFGDEPRVRLLNLGNGGKARALNEGLKLAKGEIIIALDADTQFEPLTIAKLARWFYDPDIGPTLGAVAGNAKVGNQVNLVTRWQGVEYVTAQNLERRALDQLDAIMVVPGAVGAWRRQALDEVGGYPHDTLAEDQDLTIAIQRAGWKIAYDVDAVAWTESPESFRALSKQRFRWAYGTLQCLWKHRTVFASGKPAGLAWVGIPQAWLFQIGFAMISPLIDLALLVSIGGTILRVIQHGWDQTQSDVLRMGVYWLAFTTIDLLCGWIAYALETREKRFPALLLIGQRFIYCQLMYSVVIRAVMQALRGPWVGWGKLERSGNVAAAGPHP